MSNVWPHKHANMRNLLFFLAVVTLLDANAGGLERLDQVDLIELDPKTSQLQLLVLLDEDRVNTRQAVKALYKKFNNYQDFIQSGQALASTPNGSKALRPVVILVAPKEATSGEMQNLAGLKLAAAKAGVEVEVRSHINSIRAKPVTIERGAAKSGA